MTGRQALGDFIDSPIAFVYTASALWVTGYLTQVNTFLFTEVWTYSTLSLNWAGLLGYAGLVFAYFFNDRDLSDFGDVESIVVLILLVVHTLVAFIPSVRTAVTGSEPVAVFLLFIYVVGYGILSGSWAFDDDKNPLGGVL